MSEHEVKPVLRVSDPTVRRAERAINQLLNTGLTTHQAFAVMAKVFECGKPNATGLPRVDLVHSIEHADLSEFATRVRDHAARRPDVAAQDICDAALEATQIVDLTDALVGNVSTQHARSQA